MTRKPCIVARNNGIAARCIYHGAQSQFWCANGCIVARAIRPDAKHLDDAPPKRWFGLTWMGARMRLRGGWR